MSSETYEATTRGIRVRVQPAYLAGRSNPGASRYVWSYTVDIENCGAMTVQLLSRRWIISDAVNRIEVVAGPGVVGEQPILRPGETFRYVSGCPLTTASGAMHGTYQMRIEDGEDFDVAIPMFSLHLPQAKHRVN